MIVLASLIALVTAGPSLRVCADPDNLPFSNDRLEGFENRVAAVLGRELGLPVRYTWHAQRRGFIRETLAAGACDVVMGVPSGLPRVATTRPYYRSSYVFVWRRAEAAVRSFDDPALRRLKVAVTVLGDDGADPPPVAALARRGIVQNVVGFPIIDGLQMVDAVAEGKVDLAVVWGPLAGYRARGARLQLAPVSPATEGGLPFVFPIAVAVRPGDEALRVRLETALERRHGEVERILERFGVPRV